MHTYKLIIAYDGTNYAGWQVQKNSSTIQEAIQKNLAILFDEKISLVGSSRTDAGVHALGQVAHFRTEKEKDPHKILRALNGMLPLDIRILDVTLEANTFHAQRSAKRKVYHYKICNSQSVLPFDRLYITHVPYRLNYHLMEESCKKFVGKHNFCSFANECLLGAAKRNPFKTIYRLDLVKTTNGAVFEFEGDGFLYKMVRNIVGTIIEVGRGKIPLDSIDDIFAAQDRKKAPKAAPAKGLFLVSVIYK